ncbi:MAG: hypothetical protein HYT97_03985 [Elusimicrobia bacterium]|nr:hypothetical protein [Elusimicrobiota bacterium]
MFNKKVASWFWMIVLAHSSYQCFAGTDGYFTTYNHHVEKGEVELMLMNDYTAPSKFKREERQGEYFSHMLELEYGVSERFSTEFMVEWFEDTEKGHGKFTGFRWENRYLLLTDEQFPFNVMVYGEYEDLHAETRFKMETSGWIDPPYKQTESEEPDRERIMETRLILSKDFGSINAAFNTIHETDVSDGTTAFGYSFGVIRHVHPMNHGADKNHCPCQHSMKNCQCAHCNGTSDQCTCKMGGSVGLGFELFGGVGDSKKFDIRPSRQEHYLGPILVYHISPRVMTHLQFGIGLSRASDNLVRLNVGYEF